MPSWLMVALVPLMSCENTSPLTSPATLIWLLPRPPMTRTATPVGVDRTSIVSSPSRALISMTWMLRKVTNMPAPKMPWSVTTMWSANSVPRMISLLKPVPPSTETGAFMLYSTWLLPAPVRTSVSAAVENPLVRIGIGRQYGAEMVMQPPGSLMLPTPSVWASAKPRTMNRLLPPSPSRCSTAWLLYTVNVLLPVPPWATSGSLVPRDSQPRVVATVATSKTFSAARLPERP